MNRRATELPNQHLAIHLLMSQVEPSADTAVAPTANFRLRPAGGLHQFRHHKHEIVYYNHTTSYCRQPTPNSVPRTSPSVLQALHFVLPAAHEQFGTADVPFCTTNAPRRTACGRLSTRYYGRPILYNKQSTSYHQRPMTNSVLRTS